MTPGTTEHDRPIGRMFLHCRPKSIHAFAACHAAFKLFEFETAVSPGDLPKIDRVLDADVMEWNKRFLCDPVADCRVMGKVVIEDTGNVHSIGTFRSSCEAQNEIRLDLGEHSAVTRRVRVVDLVDNDIVKFLLATIAPRLPDETVSEWTQPQVVLKGHFAVRCTRLFSPHRIPDPRLAIMPPLPGPECGHDGR